MTLAALAAAIIALHAPAASPPSVVCYPTAGAYFAAARIEPERFWPGGVAGFYGYPAPGFATLTIGLTPQECADLAALRTGYTWQRGYAAFVFSHEIGHAMYGSDEATADRTGIALAARVAYALGLRGRGSFAQLARDVPRLVGPPGA